MKYFLTTLAVFSALFTVCIFIALIWIFVTSGGNFNIILPGLGLVVSGWLFLAVLLVFGLLTLALTLALFRMIRRKPLR